MDLHEKKLTYIEESGLMFEQLGMTRMIGRVFGYIIVSDKDAVSFDEIKDATGASKGSISSTTKQLVQIGLIEPVTFPGDRKTYYRITKIELGRMLRMRMQMFSQFSQILTKGKELKERDDDISQWLLEAATFYNWIGGEIDRVIDKWHQEKDKIIENQLNHENPN